MYDLKSCENLINKRRKNIVNYLDDFLLKDVSKIISEYDYYIEGKAYTFVGHTASIYCMTLLPDFRIVTGSRDSTLRIWNPFSGNCDIICTGHSDKVLCSTLLPDSPSCCCFAAERIASGSSDGTIKIWNTQNGNCDITYTEDLTWVTSICSLSDGRIVSGSIDIHRCMKIWNPITGKGDTSFGELDQKFNENDDYNNYVNCIIPLSSGKIIIGSADSRIIIWDPQTGKCDAEFIGINDPLRIAILSNERIVTATYDNTLKIWDLKTGECEMTFIGHTYPITCVKILSDQRIISSSSDHTCKIWNQKTGNCDLTFSGHSQGVHHVSALPDRRIVSASSDKTLKIWNAQTGKCDVTLNGYCPSCYDIIILPDGRIVAASSDNTIKIWS
jgi:WD40 repeat protein